MKTPEEMLIRGKGSFINCTDYDDAIAAMKEYVKEKCNEYTPFLPQNRLYGLIKSICGVFVSIGKIMR